MRVPGAVFVWLALAIEAGAGLQSPVTSGQPAPGSSPAAARLSSPGPDFRPAFFEPRQPVPQSRPGTIAPPADSRSRETGLLRVRVASLSGAPLRRALVAIEGAGVGATTDADGLVELKLPEGRWVASASRDGYLTLRSGQRGPRELPRPFVLGAGRTLNVTMLLPRCGVLAGRVMDEMGEPLPKVRVRALRYVWVQGRRTIVPAGEAESNAAGLYSIAGLPAATYILNAARFGELPGGDSSGFAATYYPGTWDAAQATTIDLGVEHELTGLDFRLIPGRVARVSGTVLDATGKPALPGGSGSGGSVSLYERIAGDQQDVRAVATAPVGTGGGFVLQGIAPGNYVLRASVPRPSTGARVVLGGLMLTPSNDIGALSLSVNQADILGVVLTVGTGGALTGTVDVEGQAAGMAAPSFSLVAVPTDHPSTADDPTVPVRANSRFGLAGLAGPMLIRAVNLPSEWSLKAVVISGRDYTDTPYDFRGNETLSARVIVADRVTAVTGTVTDDRGQPAPDFAVVVFPRDRRQWMGATRSMQAARPDQQGRFSIRELPGGDYYAAVSMGLDADEWTNPDFLQQLAARAVSFSLNEGETKTLSLKLPAGT
jgi:hypothetical protein